MQLSNDSSNVILSDRAPIPQDKPQLYYSTNSERTSQLADMLNPDTIFLVAIFIFTIGLLSRPYWKSRFVSCASPVEDSTTKTDDERSVVQGMMGLDCMVFYGSQTGTAENYAARLAKEASSRFGLKTALANLEDYDYEELDQLSNDKTLMFVLATCGEGEATDNAQDFHSFITSKDVAFSANQGDHCLSHLRYVTFGLGNSTYEHYNKMVRDVSRSFDYLGAKRIGPAGEGDDKSGTTEEDFLSWKEPMWVALATELGLKQRNAKFEPAFKIEERDLSPEDATVFPGEPNDEHLNGVTGRPFGASNPYIAPIPESRELFKCADRNCLHLEIDISKSGLTYTTGDHIAIWPKNSETEVGRFLKIFGLFEKRRKVISISGPDSKLSIPSPTTYEVVVRSFLEVCGPVSRQFIAALEEFSPTATTQAEIRKLGSDKLYFSKVVSSKKYNIAQFLEAHFNESWDIVPFSFLIEGLPKLQARYYSISSSSVAQPNVISITAVVESAKAANANHLVKGVATNYLLALKQMQHGLDSLECLQGLEYDLSDQRSKYNGICVPVHVRRSNFRLPLDNARPIIMVGPGTGVAPFRAFVQERAHQARQGQQVGKVMLFFGCRDAEDFLYKKEWEVSLCLVCM